MMDWSERQAWFERLLVLRDGYVRSDDRVGDLSIADAIRYVEAVMAAVDLDTEPWVLEPDGAAPRGPHADTLGENRARRPEAMTADPSHRPRYRRAFASDLWPWPTPSTIRSSGEPRPPADEAG